MRIFVKLAMITAMVLSGACSENNFQGGVPSQPSDDGNGFPGNSNIGGQNGDGTNGDGTFNNGTFAQSGQVVTQSFQLTRSSTKKVDLVWIIDNSSSMSQEAANVRKNFQAFISSLAGLTDLKLALISTPSGSYGASLPVSGPNYLQIPQIVASTDSLLIAASASCRSDTNNFAASILCGQPVQSIAIYANRTAGKVSGQLHNFFRPDAHRVYVVVTDDNATIVDQSNFMNLMQVTSRIAPTVFAFSGKVSGANCSVARVGVAYETLARATGGETFNICDPDWQPHFSKLTSNVESIANNEFILTKNPANIEFVKVDDQLINSTSYNLFGRKLRINAGVLGPSNRKVQVRYLEK